MANCCNCLQLSKPCIHYCTIHILYVKAVSQTSFVVLHLRLQRSLNLILVCILFTVCEQKKHFNLIKLPRTNCWLRLCSIPNTTFFCSSRPNITKPLFELYSVGTCTGHVHIQPSDTGRKELVGPIPHFSKQNCFNTSTRLETIRFRSSELCIQMTQWHSTCSCLTWTIVRLNFYLTCLWNTDPESFRCVGRTLAICTTFVIVYVADRFDYLVICLRCFCVLCF